MTKPAVIAIDMLMLLIFALLARIAHNSPELPLSFLGVLNTAWPFWIGAALAWLVLHIRRSPLLSIKPTGLSIWISSVVVGLAIWGIKHAAFPHWSFIIVASVTSAVLLLGWRAIA